VRRSLKDHEGGESPPLVLAGEGQERNAVALAHPRQREIDGHRGPTDVAPKVTEDAGSGELESGYRTIVNAWITPF
jgi:hypothetical protein